MEIGSSFSPVSLWSALNASLSSRTAARTGDVAPAVTPATSPETGPRRALKPEGPAGLLPPYIPYISPVIIYDNLGRLAVVAFRDRNYGAITGQIPSESDVGQRRRNNMPHRDSVPGHDTKTQKGTGHAGSPAKGTVPAGDGRGVPAATGNVGQSGPSEQADTGAQPSSPTPAAGPGSAGGSDQGRDQGSPTAPSGSQAPAAAIAPGSRVSLQV